MNSLCSDSPVCNFLNIIVYIMNYMLSIDLSHNNLFTINNFHVQACSPSSQ
jgi:hypothetical protein